MAARRERDRRRPGAERRYRFATPQPPPEADEALAEPEVDGAAAAEPIEEARATHRRAERQTRAETPRVSAKPFSAYKDEYAYVYGDLRRVGAVIGSLLVILIVLYFLLPILVH
jgi:hypothetical protein